MDFKLECTENRSDLRITFRERRSSVTFDNPLRKECLCVTVDGCQITSGVRCDKLLVCQDIEYFIELKGSDVKHAIEQLEASIRLLGANHAISRQAYIIATSCSPKLLTTIQKSKLKFKKNLHSSLIVERAGFVVKI